MAGVRLRGTRGREFLGNRSSLGRERVDLERVIRIGRHGRRRLAPPVGGEEFPRSELIRDSGAGYLTRCNRAPPIHEFERVPGERIADTLRQTLRPSARVSRLPGLEARRFAGVYQMACSVPALSHCRKRSGHELTVSPG